MLYHVSTAEERKAPFQTRWSVSHHSNGRVGRTVHRTPTHTNLYLNTLSHHHHPTQKNSVFLVHRAMSISTLYDFENELQFLTEFLVRHVHFPYGIQKCTLSIIILTELYQNPILTHYTPILRTQNYKPYSQNTPKHNILQCLDRSTVNIRTIFD